MASLCKVLYDRSVFSDEFFIKWHAGKMKMDRQCIVFDKKSEKAMRPLMDDFITWLQSDEYDEEADYGNEEAEAEETKEGETGKNSEGPKNAQQALIE